MTFRSSTTPADRAFGCLPYLLPIIESLPFGLYLMALFPPLSLIFVPLIPLIRIYTGVPFAGLIIFFLLFLAVVRNPKISHFIRFNTMQAILIDIVLTLFSLLFNTILLPALGSNLITQTLANTVFIGILAACGYCIFQSVFGRYAEIPAISEAVYAQVP
ncbi:Tic20 family protein [Merismopedia glauca]|uniref:Tic20 family protein n=1 Tax=Merismopedia glauca CCAP 1448/3 TaxID=1296344 RepID=A0A2T1C0T7_9CYAN|nr:Tic20 family protein [Merismopedia glauca]PSB01895.1 hypothetical protein C7B64_15885 [Merismopedia glauca CCAP 1448/3]